MKIILVIPARYQSTRLPGKPLVDICGKPMIWWVYSEMKKSHMFSDVVVAIDDTRIENICKELSINYIMTENNHPNHISRICEVSNKIEADYYVCVNGDEPLLDVRIVESVLPHNKEEIEYFCGTYRELTDPVETIDNGNIKVVLDKNGRCIFMSRTPIPFPKNSLNFKYNKYVGIEIFTKKGLDVFQKNKKEYLENIEDIDHLRYIENQIPIYFKKVESDSISVDTSKDLEKVRKMMENKLK